MTLDLIRTYRALAANAYLEVRPAAFEELSWFHQPGYVRALQACQRTGRIEAGIRQKYNIGNFENPFFENMFTIPALAAGGSIQGAELVLAGSMAFNPAGGMHHAMPGKARGFCYLNDAVLGVMRLRQAGLRVLYLDLDAHHGDGVQHAFDADPDVLTVSIHMDTSYAYPRRGGGINDVGGCGRAVNLPLPKSVNDSEYRLVFSTLWPEILASFQPDSVVLQTGTDMLSQDPLGKWNISNRLFLEVVQGVMATTPLGSKGIPRLLVLGGGGYHPLVLARCWTGVWDLLAGWHLPAGLTPEGRQVLESIHWGDGEEGDLPAQSNLLESRYDPPLEGPIRKEINLRLDDMQQTHPLFA